MSEKQGRREEIGRMTEHLVKHGMSPEKAASTARDAAIRADRRDESPKNWKKPYGSND